MRIAFCVSGIPRSGIGQSEKIHENFHRNRKSHARAFPSADFYYGTWNEYEEIVKNSFPDDSIVSFEEPAIDYHPFYDISPEFMWSERLVKIVPKYKTIKDHRQDRYIHQTKQILCHAYLIDHFNLKEKYDIIIRARYDTYISHQANFQRFLDDVHENPKAVGFALLKDNNFDQIKTIPKDAPNGKRFLFDSLIIHSSKIFDTEEVYKLNSAQNLLPCEFGWFQTMSYPYGENHQCYSGWANADRAVPNQYLKGN
jgi:hypothetical protein